jgi:FAS-associated factor 2
MLRSVWNYGYSFLTYFWPSGGPELDPTAASSKFQTDFESQYGNVHPNFLTGSFQQACTQSRTQFKFLIVYLHSPMHQHTAEFCR